MQLAWLLLLNFAVVFGLQDKPPCIIDGIGGTAWWIESFSFDSIDDNHAGETAQFQCTNVKEVRIENSTYLLAALQDNVLTFSVTEEFKKFEMQESATALVADFYIKCLIDEEATAMSLDEDERAEKEELEDVEYHLKLFQSIIDFNTFEPTFTKKEYVFKYYQDLSSYVMLTEAQRISAEDRDISNEQYFGLTFTIEDNEYFSISATKDDFNRRLVHAIVKPNKYIKAPFEGSYNITVTDNGKPEVKSSTAKLTVQLFTEQTLVFTKSVYNGETDGESFKLVDGPIEIEGGQDLGTEFEIFSDDGNGIADKFVIKQRSQSITLDLKVGTSLHPELIESRDYLYLRVTANKLGRVGHFAVMIKTTAGQSSTTTTTTEESSTEPSTTTTTTEESVTEPGTTTTTTEESSTEPSTTTTEESVTEPSTTTTEGAGTEPITTSSPSGGIETSLEAFEKWILTGTVLVWISFTLLSIALLMVMFSFKKYWQKRYNL